MYCSTALDGVTSTPSWTRRHSEEEPRARARYRMIGPEPPPSTKRKRDGNEEEEDEEKRHRHRRHQPDFNRLAAKYDYFARHVITTKKNATTTTTTTTIDFTSWQATHDLCRALLEEIGVQNWSIPEGHLVPGFTQRRNYCEWVESLLEKDGVRLEEDNIRGVDVGTGASAIFCLLYTSPSPRDATLSRMPSSA